MTRTQRSRGIQLKKKMFGLSQWRKVCGRLSLNYPSRLQPKRVFQTVKNLNLMRQQRSSLAPSPLNIPGSNQTSCLTSGRSSRVGTPRSNSIYSGEIGSGIILDNRTSSILEGPDDGQGHTTLQLALQVFIERSALVVSDSQLFTSFITVYFLFLPPFISGIWGMPLAVSVDLMHFCVYW